MYVLRLLVRVGPDTRREFRLSAAQMAGQASPARSIAMESLDGQGLFCWMADCPTKETLDGFMRSDLYKAIRGAALVLGTLEAEVVCEVRSVSRRVGPTATLRNVEGT